MKVMLDHEPEDRKGSVRTKEDLASEFAPGDIVKLMDLDSYPRPRDEVLYREGVVRGLSSSHSLRVLFPNASTPWLHQFIHPAAVERVDVPDLSI